MSEIINIKSIQSQNNRNRINFESKLEYLKKKNKEKTSKNVSVPIFRKHGHVSVVGKTKGWLPYAINRIRRRSKTVAVIEPSTADLEILSKFGFDETILRLSRLRVALDRTDYAKTNEGMAAIRRIELHVSAMYIVAQKIEASNK